MASEYLKQKYKDVKPDEKVELTAKQKRENWWYYHKVPIAVGVVIALLAANLIWDVTGLGKTKPDVQVAYIGGGTLPEDTIMAIEEGLSSLCEDLNGDGQVLVQMRSYVTGNDSEPQAVMATNVQLIADISACESFLFLLEDPEGFQTSYHALSRLDGSLPEEDDCSVEGVVLQWKDCPALSGLDLGEYAEDLFGSTLSGSNQELLSSLYIARRGFWTEQDEAYRDGYTALWENMIAGAVS